jgi:hypothetical protein
MGGSGNSPPNATGRTDWGLLGEDAHQGVRMYGPRGVAGGVEFCPECHLVIPCLNGAIVAYARDHPYTTLSVREIRERLGEAAATRTTRRHGRSDVIGGPTACRLADSDRRASLDQHVRLEYKLVRSATGLTCIRSTLSSNPRHRRALSSDSPSKAAGHDMGTEGLAERRIPGQSRKAL